MYFFFIQTQQWQFCSWRLVAQILQHKSKQNLLKPSIEMVQTQNKIKNIIQVWAIANRLDCIQYSVTHTEGEPSFVKGCNISFLTTCFS